MNPQLHTLTAQGRFAARPKVEGRLWIAILIAMVADAAMVIGALWLSGQWFGDAKTWHVGVCFVASWAALCATLLPLIGISDALGRSAAMAKVSARGIVSALRAES